jgi:hypothetical protein
MFGIALYMQHGPHFYIPFRKRLVKATIPLPFQIVLTALPLNCSAALLLVTSLNMALTLFLNEYWLIPVPLVTVDSLLSLQ